MRRSLEIKGGYRKFNEVSFLRAFSITTIVLMHLIQSHILGLNSFRIELFYYSGVFIRRDQSSCFFFCCCSRFGLYLSYLNKKTNYIEFIRRRFWKVYVPYILIIVVLFFLPFIEVEGNRLGALLSHVFLYKMFVLQYYSSFGVFWFVSTIFQFYFAFIPLCKLKEKVGTKPFLLICFGTSVCWWILTGISGLVNIIDQQEVFFLQYLWEFALGMVVAEYLFKGNHIVINNFVLLIVIVAISGVILEAFLAYSDFSFGKIFNDIPALFGYGSIALLLYQVSVIKKTLLPIDCFSYEWYLLHGALFVGVSTLASSISFTINRFVVAGICFVLSIILSYLYHMLITLVESSIKQSKGIERI